VLIVKRWIYLADKRFSFYGGQYYNEDNRCWPFLSIICIYYCVNVALCYSSLHALDLLTWCSSSLDCAEWNIPYDTLHCRHNFKLLSNTINLLFDLRTIRAFLRQSETNFATVSELAWNRHAIWYIRTIPAKMTLDDTNFYLDQLRQRQQHPHHQH
jgi:hypothetical protein